jgi:hypothetical protein
MFKLKINKKWAKKAAKLEEGHDISAGSSRPIENKSQFIKGDIVIIRRGMSMKILVHRRIIENWEKVSKDPHVYYKEIEFGKKVVQKAYPTAHFDMRGCENEECCGSAPEILISTECEMDGTSLILKFYVD